MCLFDGANRHIHIMPRHAFDGEHNVKFFKLRVLYVQNGKSKEGRAERERERVSGLESDQFIYIAQSAKHYSYGNLLIIISLLRIFFYSILLFVAFHSFPLPFYIVLQNSVFFSVLLCFILSFLLFENWIC